MGWSYTHKPPGVSVREFLEQEFQGSDRLIDVAVVGLREAYAAIRTADGRVVGAVILLDYRPRDFYNFGYKIMDEEMGPFCYRCPERILRQLSPTTNEHALEWRRHCQEELARRQKRIPLRPGMKVRAPEPIRFADGRYRQEFVVLRMGRHLRFRAEDGLLCRIRDPHQYAWIVVSA